MLQANDNARCTPYCCKTDFCNNQCGTQVNHTTAIVVPTKSTLTRKYSQVPIIRPPMQWYLSEVVLTVNMSHKRDPFTLKIAF